MADSNNIFTKFVQTKQNFEGEVDCFYIMDHLENQTFKLKEVKKIFDEKFRIFDEKNELKKKS